MLKKLGHLLVCAFWAGLSALLTIVLVGMIAFYSMNATLPDVSSLKDMHLQVPLRIYTADKKLIAQFGVMRRSPVKLSEIPKPLIQAVLATEDARFYEHPGVDWVGLGRAIVAVISSGEKVQGASTITMQVARNFYLSPEKTYLRKVKEMLLALKINREFSKNTILELYLNKIYFGNRAYGVAAAAQVYYGKALNQLTLPEMAMLAGLPQAPSRNNPLSNPRAAVERRNHVLERMLAVGVITPTQYQSAVRAPNTARYHQQLVEVSAPYVAEMVREVMAETYGNSVYEAGLSVYTTLDSRLQNIATHALQVGLEAYDHRHGYRATGPHWGELDQQQWLTRLAKESAIDGLYPAVVASVADQSIQALLQDGRQIDIAWPGLSWARPELEDGKEGALPQHAVDIVREGDAIRAVWDNDIGEWALGQLPAVQGAFVAMNPQNGAILALDGGFDYHLSNFNRVTQAERQPGSAFKPFIYAAALSKGWTLASMINDAPIVQKDDSTENRWWRPMNDTKEFYGPTSLKEGLVQSRNLVSIRLLQTVGIPYTLNYLKLFGFDPNTMPENLSLALGTGSVSPLDLATGYAVFANGGYRVSPYWIQRIEDERGQVLAEAHPATACIACVADPNTPATDRPVPEAPRAISAGDAYLMTNMLQAVIQKGTGKKARALGRNDLAGKTGTNGKTDAWFAGYNTQLLAVVWVGFDNLRPLNEHGSEAALPIWMQFMGEALSGVPEATLPQPPEIVSVRIDPNTGLLARPNQPGQFEFFTESTVPKQYSEAPLPPSQNGEQQNEPLF